MLRYIDTLVSFQEVPDEISLCINISNCPCGCKGCHSPYLAENKGDLLHAFKLFTLIGKNEGITCVCFMGGDINPIDVQNLAKILKKFTKFKIAWYSGRQYIPEEIDLKYFDYIKIGPYIEELGPLNSPNTNQIFYRVDNIDGNNILSDITYRFRKDGF